MQRRERIGRNLRSRSGNFPQQRRFTSIWITNESRVRNRSQLEKEISLLAFFTLCVLTRRAVARALEMHITFTACSAPTKYKFFAVADKIYDRNGRFPCIER